MPRLTPIAIFLLIAATLAFATALLLYSPMQTDGGWYSYNGYALSEGRDPAENLLTLQDFGDRFSGIRAIFGWDSRGNFLVLLHSGWFTVMGHSQASLALFGILQWLLIGALVYVAVILLTRHRVAALAATLAILCDSWIMSEALADLRPDTLLALLALIGLIGIIRYEQMRQVKWAMLASTCCILLVLMHATGVIAYSFLAATSIVLAARSPELRSRSTHAIIAVSGSAAFLLRQQILDWLLPTSVSVQIERIYRNDLPAKVRGIWADGVFDKFLIEVHRWADYLFISNAMHAVLLAIGIAALVGAARVSNESTRRFASPLLWGLVTGFLVVTLLDPHVTSSHLISLVTLAYVCAGLGLCRVLNRFPRRSLMVAGLAVFAAAGLKFAHAGVFAFDAINKGISQRAVYKLMESAIPRRAVVAIAPPSLWMYVPEGRSIILYDERHTPWQMNDPRWAKVDLLLLDRDFLDRGWERLRLTLEACGAAVPIGQVGTPQGYAFFLRALRMVKPGCPNTRE